MRILRWCGVILMLLAVVTGSAMLYMRYVVASTPVYQAPHISGATMVGGGYTTDRDAARVFTVNIVISVLVFFVGLIAFAISKAFGKKAAGGAKKAT